VLPVASFELGQRVYCAAMSPLAHAHSLIAAGSGPAVSSRGQQHLWVSIGYSYPEKPPCSSLASCASSFGCQRLKRCFAPVSWCLIQMQVKLCDARSGGFTHNLTGHRQAVWAAAWSPSSQWHLATGGCDGQVSPYTERRWNIMLQIMSNDLLLLRFARERIWPTHAMLAMTPARASLAKPTFPADVRLQVRMWDIRRAGCIALLDQHASQPSAALSAMPAADEWCVTGLPR